MGGQILNEKTSKVNKQFEESLEAMKSTKLHRDLVKSIEPRSAKEMDLEFESEYSSLTLMDIYYEEGKLRAWRDNLIKQASGNSRRIERLQENLNKLRSLPSQFLRKEAGFQSYQDLKASVNKLV